MTDPLVLQQDEGAIRILTLNAPHRLNALSQAMIAALSARLDEVANDPKVRVVVLRGAGRAFCAGHDLAEMQASRADTDSGRAAFARLFADCAAMMQRLVALPQPVIAQVQGIATAAGCQLAASCDLVSAAQDARFGVNGVNIGLFCSTPAVALSRKVAPGVAFELLATGEFLPAPRAQEVGLVNRVAPAEDLDAVTLDLARTIAAKLPVALRLGKAAFRAQAGQPLATAYDQAGCTMVENLMQPETEEGMQAFLEKRPPRWSA